MSENLIELADYYYFDGECEINETLYRDGKFYCLITNRYDENGDMLGLSREDVVNWARNCGGELGLFMTSSSWLINLYTAGEEDSEFFSEDILGLTELVPAT